MRVNRGPAFAIVGCTAASRNFDAVIFGYYDGGNPMYAGRTRSGFMRSMKECRWLKPLPWGSSSSWRFSSTFDRRLEMASSDFFGNLLSWPR